MLLVAPLLDSRVDFKVLIVTILVVKGHDFKLIVALTYKKNVSTLGAPLFNSRVGFNVLFVTILDVKTMISNEL